MVIAKQVVLLVVKRLSAAVLAAVAGFPASVLAATNNQIVLLCSGTLDIKNSEGVPFHYNSSVELLIDMSKNTVALVRPSPLDQSPV